MTEIISESDNESIASESTEETKSDEETESDSENQPKSKSSKNSKRRHEDDDQQEEVQSTPLASVENRMVLRKRVKKN